MKISRTGGGYVAYPPGATFGPRRLQDYEFVWIMKGNVVYEADGRSHDVPPGSLVLGQQGWQETYRWDPLHQTQHAFFHFTPTEADLEQLPPLTEWPVHRQMPEGDIARPLFRHILWLITANRPEWRPLLHRGVSQLLACYVTGAVHGLTMERLELPEPVEKALHAVQSMWSEGRLENPSLADLAQAAGVSDVHLCRLFRQTLGQGPITALRYLRLDRAASLLARSNLQVQEVADHTGFENPFHFSRCFKELFGVSPRAYRKQVADGGTVMPREVLNLRRVASIIDLGTEADDGAE